MWMTLWTMEIPSPPRLSKRLRTPRQVCGTALLCFEDDRHLRQDWKPFRRFCVACTKSLRFDMRLATFFDDTRDQFLSSTLVIPLASLLSLLAEGNACFAFSCLCYFHYQRFPQIAYPTGYVFIGDSLRRKWIHHWLGDLFAPLFSLFVLGCMVML
jgi:hypothetical protein